ncbi:MAG TPA: ATP synthase F1 subunit delta [Acidimicrobiia bacterium]|jgi:F-type H+-transporting ATPase subunit delta|nr:ATP synthase F1 subunit delta [Acidimicrobiia bacterium]
MERIDAYAHAMLEIARTEDRLPQVEDELFRFGRIIEGNDDLRMALANPGLPADQRAKIVDELLENRALQVSRALVSMVVGAGRGHDLPAIISRFVELVAESRQHEVAEVRAAKPLSDAEVEQLAQVLSRATDKNIEVKVIIDPTVMGGIVATIGDTVIDGTVRHRLEQLKESL